MCSRLMVYGGLFSRVLRGWFFVCFVLYFFLDHSNGVHLPWLSLQCVCCTGFVSTGLLVDWYISPSAKQGGAFVLYVS